MRQKKRFLVEIAKGTKKGDLSVKYNLEALTSKLALHMREFISILFCATKSSLIGYCPGHWLKKHLVTRILTSFAFDV